MKYAIGNAQHIGGRKVQMDAFGFSNPNDAAFVEHGGLLAVVADGIGSLEGSGAAAKAAVRALVRAYERKAPSEAVQDALTRALSEAVAEVRTAAKMHGDVGTTLVAAVMAQGALHWLSVGDSALLLVRDGAASQVNSPHTLATRLDRDAAENRISLKEARENPERESLTSYLGPEPPPEVDRNRQPLQLSPADRVVLCSDGLSKVVPFARISELCDGAPQQAATALVAEALKNGGAAQDNTTVLVFWQEQAEASVLAAPASRAPAEAAPAAVTAAVLAPDPPSPVPSAAASSTTSPATSMTAAEEPADPLAGRPKPPNPLLRAAAWIIAAAVCLAAGGVWFLHAWKVRHKTAENNVEILPAASGKDARDKPAPAHLPTLGPNLGDPAGSPHRGDPNATAVGTPSGETPNVENVPSQAQQPGGSPKAGPSPSKTFRPRSKM